MFVSTDNLEETIKRTFPFPVRARIVDHEGSSEHIWLSEAFRQCEARLGSCASHAAVKNPNRRYFRFNSKAKWDVVGMTFYFKMEEEAAIFRTCWG
jgi:hypothetical protein